MSIIGREARQAAARACGMDPDQRYEEFCRLVDTAGHLDAVRFLRAFRADEDLLAEAIVRWHREHVTGPDGRLLGTVHQAGPGTWEAHDGRQTSRVFDTELQARAWLLGDPAGRGSATTPPGGVPLHQLVKRVADAAGSDRG